MTRRRLTFLLVALALTAVAIPVGAITNGTLDGDDHPYVGLSVHDVGGTPSHRCSGSLISPTVFVTAGHCTFGTSGGRVWFDTDVGAGRPDNGYPFAGGTGVEAVAAFSHPLYDDDAFFLFDVGVMILSEPVALARYASLPDVGAVDALGKGRKTAVITAVGYGLQAVVPRLMADLVRYRADLFVVDTDGVAGLGHLSGFFPGSGSMSVSGDAEHGGTCFGDSGGPNLIAGTDTIVGVTSFGLNFNCAGIGGTYRIDKQTDLDFIADPTTGQEAFDHSAVAASTTPSKRGGNR
jgi:hypothetical protein